MRYIADMLSTFLRPFSLIAAVLLSGCVGNMSPTGGQSRPENPFYITTSPLTIKRIAVPIGTTLVYAESMFRKNQQAKLLDEKDLVAMKFPLNEPVIWAGVPVASIHKFFNTSMRGVSLEAQFNAAPKIQRTNFSKLWQSCSSDLGIMLKSLDDWSFNPANVEDVDSCGVLYQRYFKKDEAQQAFLDRLLLELKKVGSP